MIKYFSLLLAFAFLLNSCGKKEEPQQTIKEQEQKKQEQSQTQMTDPNKEAEREKEEELKKKEEAEKKKKEEAEKKKKEEAEKKKKEEEMKKDEEKKDEATEIDFAPIFAKKCVKCHGANGKGKIEGAPDFTSSKTKSKSDNQLMNIIKNGVKAETEEGEDMPSWKGKLTEDEIKAAVKYIRKF